MKPLYPPLAVGFFILSFSFTLCQILGVYVFHESCISWLPCIFIGITLGLVCLYLAQPCQIFRRELFLTTGLLWVTTCTLGALPYLLVGHCDFTTSLFESISGLTTTGATNLHDIESMPRSLLLWRALSQWIGGLGFVVFFISFMGQSNRTDKRLLSNEESALGNAMSLYHFRSYTLSVLRVYMGLTLCCCACLIYFKMPWLDAICHALTTVSTGGFSTYNTGLLEMDNGNIEVVITVFMLLGGINFLYLIQIFTPSGPNIIYNHEFRVYLLWLLACISLFVYVLTKFSIYPFRESLHQAFFQVVSISTTTGFASCDFTLWPKILFGWLLLITFIGGCSGSTAGGFKMSRTIVLVRILGHQFEKVYHPDIVRTLRIDGYLWDNQRLMKMMHFFILTCVLLVGGTCLLQWVETNLDILPAFSAVLACLSNVGIGITADIGPAGSFADFSSAAKLILSTCMLLGRLELYTLLILFIPHFWKKFE